MMKNWENRLETIACEKAAEIYVQMRTSSEREPPPELHLSGPGRISVMSQYLAIFISNLCLPQCIPVTRVSNGQGGWADLILTKHSSPPPFATSALLLSSLV